MSSKSQKNVLAANPLDAVLGFGDAIPKAQKGRGGPELVQHRRAQEETPVHEPELTEAAPAPKAPKNEVTAVEPEATRRSEPRLARPPEEQPHGALVTPPAQRAPAPSSPRTDSVNTSRLASQRLPEGPQQPSGEPGASLKHRIGTIKEPYIRTDGTRVRQWSITLPENLIRRVSHLALDRGVKPAELAQRALERFLIEEE